MSKISKEEKSTVKKALLRFKKSGLESYAEYLEEQLKNSEGKEIKASYNKYIKKELKRTLKQISKVDAKLGIVGVN